MQFTSRLIAERSAIPSRNSLKENEYFVHCYIRPDGLVGCCITDEEYQVSFLSMIEAFPVFFWDAFLKMVLFT
jgi:synaptobrevin family protein YKT6